MVDIVTRSMFFALFVTAIMFGILFLFKDEFRSFMVTYGLYLLSLTAILILGSIGISFSKRWGTSFLLKDLEYLGYKNNEYTITESISSTYGGGSFSYTEKFITPIAEPRKRLKPLNRVFAFLAYRADISNPLRKRNSYEGKDEEGRIYDVGWNEQYFNYKLRKEVYAAIKLEKQIHKTEKISYMKEEGYFPLASIIFAGNLYPDTSLDINMERLSFFARNNYLPSIVHKLQDVPMEDLEPFDGILPSWTQRVLLSLDDKEN